MMIIKALQQTGDNFSPTVSVLRRQLLSVAVRVRHDAVAVTVMLFGGEYSAEMT
jgi:hypothetical protein